MCERDTLASLDFRGAVQRSLQPSVYDQDRACGRHAAYAALDNSRYLGAIAVEVTLLPQGTVGFSEQRRRAQAEHAAEEARRAARQQAAADADRFSEIVEALSIRAELNRNWADPQYRADFARLHAEELVQRQSEIRTDANQLLEQHRVVTYLRRHDPMVLATLLGRFESLLLAEKLSLDRAIAAGEAPKPTQPQSSSMNARNEN